MMKNATITEDGTDPFLALLTSPSSPSEAPAQVVPAHLAEAPKPEPCGKCGGRGVLPEFRHISGGVCFACEGTGRKMAFVTYGADAVDAV